MLFSSYEFIFAFLPITFLVYFFLTGRRLLQAARVWLVLASLFFYSWWNINYLPLILGSMLCNFALGAELAKPGDEPGPRHIRRKTLLALGVAGNLALLGYFKYVDFFLGTFNVLLDLQLGLTGIALPLAISFFTFQQIAYLVDCYRRETKESDFLGYALFVTFFPQLIAGPIVHHREMIPQFASRWNAVRRYRNVALGLFIFSMGLFKKVVIADTFAQWATPGFDEGEALGFAQAWATSLSYTFQLYFDFSGYTDMAIGAALLFNIRLPINFNSPYKALSIQDFWRRWHITLSRFLRDYLYVPLGGNRRGRGRMYANLFVTFLLGGLWHGASWMFVFWGGLHGAALVVHRIWQRLGGVMPDWLGWLLTFNFVNVTWVLFRAPDLTSAWNIYRGMLGLGGWQLAELPAWPRSVLVGLTRYYVHFETGLWIGLALLAVLCLRNSTCYLHGWRMQTRHAWLAGLALALSVSQLSSYSEFIYFNF
ncbi:MBOAT family protein [Pseudomonas sp. NCCP-436]|uniref:MBOAT family O-acyltransferase n=1 Tax=Pseudomonas sp. NCCP-436 TaxID=2842481 RepID=UPI001C7E22F4|nr:MBOAT family protein [Pseudomonas sp. NCCP-436]GIZ11939.1 peptidoglycan O-acetyltransferase [Pseudomonas sp. NCCP-436]